MKQLVHRNHFHGKSEGWNVWARVAVPDVSVRRLLFKQSIALPPSPSCARDLRSQFVSGLSVLLMTRCEVIGPLNMDLAACICSFVEVHTKAGVSRFLQPVSLVWCFCRLRRLVTCIRGDKLEGCKPGARSSPSIFFRVAFGRQHCIEHRNDQFLACILFVGRVRVAGLSTSCCLGPEQFNCF